MTPPPFPQLPVELTNLILENAVKNERTDVWRFVVLSKPIRRSLEMTLYESVVLANQEKAKAFLHNIQSEPRRASYVQALCCWGLVPHEVGSIIVSLCTNLRRLAYWCIGGAGQNLLNVIRTIQQPLLSLSGWFEDHPLQLGSPTLRSLQYLDILDDWKSIQRWDWEELCHLGHFVSLTVDDLVFWDPRANESELPDTDRAALFMSVIMHVTDLPWPYMYDLDSLLKRDDPEGRIMISKRSNDFSHAWWLHDMNTGKDNSSA